jgi:hypothetical protein
MVSFTVPGFMLTVICVELLMVGVFPVFHTPDPAPTPHLNCTMFPLCKLLPKMVSVWLTPSAVIVVGLTLLTEGVGTTAVSPMSATHPSTPVSRFTCHQV